MHGLEKYTLHSKKYPIVKAWVHFYRYCYVRQYIAECYFVYFNSLYALSMGFACYFFICTELTQLCSFFGFPGLCVLGRIKRIVHWENYNSELIIKTTILFIETNMYIRHYLSEPGVRCSSHTSLPSIYLLSGVTCWARSGSKSTLTFGFPLI